jgi:hypothetical protein
MRLNFHFAPALALAMSLLPACDNERETTYTDFQAFCADPDPDGLAITAHFATCTSSSCDIIQSSSCELTQTDNGWELTGEAVVQSSGTTCTADCGSVTAQCSVDVSEGTFDIRAGDLTLNVDVPVQMETCAGFAP